MSKRTWNTLMPSDEELKPLDEISKKYLSHELIILDEEPSRTRIGKFLDFISPSFDTLSGDFSHAVREYNRLKFVIKDTMQDYKLHPTTENEDFVQISIMSFRRAADSLNVFYHKALGEHRVDEGRARELEELKQRVKILEADLVRCEEDKRKLQTDLEGLQKLTGFASTVEGADSKEKSQ